MAAADSPAALACRLIQGDFPYQEFFALSPAERNEIYTFAVALLQAEVMKLKAQLLAEQHGIGSVGTVEGGGDAVDGAGARCELTKGVGARRRDRATTNPGRAATVAPGGEERAGVAPGPSESASASPQHPPGHGRKS